MNLFPSPPSSPPLNCRLERPGELPPLPPSYTLQETPLLPAKEHFETLKAEKEVYPIWPPHVSAYHCNFPGGAASEKVIERQKELFPNSKANLDVITPAAIAPSSEKPIAGKSSFFQFASGNWELSEKGLCTEIRHLNFIAQDKDALFTQLRFFCTREGKIGLCFYFQRGNRDLARHLQEMGIAIKEHHLRLGSYQTLDALQLKKLVRLMILYNPLPKEYDFFVRQLIG